MPVEFSGDEALRRYGRYAGEPSEEQLHRYFRFDDHDRGLISTRRGKHHQLAFALQLATLRFLGTFLPNPLDIPEVALTYVARQLDLPIHQGKLDRYAVGERRWDHQAQIREMYGYKPFSDPPEVLGLVRFLYARARLTAESPSVLFDLATARLVERKVLLPGVTTLTRLIARVCDRAEERLWRDLARQPNASQRANLDALLQVPEGAHVSPLERLRKPPTSVTPKGLMGALKRVEAVRLVGVQGVDLAAFPEPRLAALARSGMRAKAQALRRMTSDRRLATLLVTVHRLEAEALDDALTVFDSLLTDLFNRIDRRADEGRLDTLPSLEEAALRTHRLAVAFLQTLEDERRDFEAFIRSVLALVPREQLQQAVDTIQGLTRPRRDTHIENLLERYGYVQPFVPLLLNTVGFEAGHSGRPTLAAIRALRSLERRKRIATDEVPLDVVRGGWEKVIERGEGELHRPAYTLCVLENMQSALKRRDLYVPASGKFGDPRMKLLSGRAWEALKPELCRSLNLDPDPKVVLTQMSEQLDAAYRLVESRLPENTQVKVEEKNGRTFLTLSEDEALPEPPSLIKLRAAVTALLPRIDLPELLLEVNTWTGFAEAFTHLSEARSRVDDLALSVCAVLLAEACNVGLEAVTRGDVEALRRGRLSWVDQNYVRAETIASANARLVDHQAQLPLVALWGSGQVAAVDGLRFKVPVKTIHAGHNPKYFGVGNGVTYLNFVSDQFSGFHGIVVPGTLRDSLYALDGLLEQNTSLKPRQLISDTGASSEMVFGLFRLLSYQFSPLLADIAERRYWRMDKGADYGRLNALAAHRIDTRLIAAHWDDLLRIAGSLVTGTVKASDLLKVIGVKPKGSLARALEAFGRVPATLHLLTYHDDPQYRRTIGTQRNMQEARHSLARAVFGGRRGELRQPYRTGQEDQLGALGLVLNAITLWNSRYLGLAVEHLRAQGYEVRDEDVERLSPLRFEHIHLEGRYAFTLAEAVKQGGLRPLRDPDDVLNE
ncbi:Tn3 family transposase (plasmid) [Deinococcus wulumuqiensis]|uniref:Tn3 family transposase n=2 Tax=Deinococcus TaxID=1298 RepID=A0A345IN50_9DEIO|nr:Tn3 family transposase [Deinococcus wulumuqiensis]AXH01123.1 Tn3 family transposase [Deinococcus wulumuqiensis]